MALLAYRSLQIGHSTLPEDDDGVLLTEEEEDDEVGPALFAAGSELLGLVLGPTEAADFSGGRFTSSISGPTPPLAAAPLPSMSTSPSSLLPSQLAAWYSTTPLGKFLPQSGHWIRRWFCSEPPLTPPWRRRVPPACAFGFWAEF